MFGVKPRPGRVILWRALGRGTFFTAGGRKVVCWCSGVLLLPGKTPNHFQEKKCQKNGNELFYKGKNIFGKGDFYQENINSRKGTNLWCGGLGIKGALGTAVPLVWGSGVCR